MIHYIIFLAFLSIVVAFSFTYKTPKNVPNLSRKYISLEDTIKKVLYEAFPLMKEAERLEALCTREFIGRLEKKNHVFLSPVHIDFIRITERMIDRVVCTVYSFDAHGRRHEDQCVFRLSYGDWLLDDIK